MDEAAGVEGLDPELLRDRHDLQHSLLLLEAAKAYDSVIAHPEPAAATAYRGFDAVQRYLREIVYGGEPRATPFASLGGITVHTVDGVRFLPLAFEFLDHEASTELFSAWSSADVNKSTRRCASFSAFASDPNLVFCCFSELLCFLRRP